MMEVKNNLAELRVKRGLGVAELARRIGVSRQTIYAIETGEYIPNTLVSLKLAGALDAPVEKIFELDTPAKPVEELVEATLLGEASLFQRGQPLRLCQVEKRVVAVAAEFGGWELPQADAVLVEVERARGHSPLGKVRPLSEKWKSGARILLAGCDPSVSFLGQAAVGQGCELVACYANSTQALELLREGVVHIAGSHLLDRSSGRAALAPLTRVFPRGSVAVFSYALWEEGMLVAPANPKRIRGVQDLARRGVRFTNREPGAGCRTLLDNCLKKAGLTGGKVNGYEKITAGHLAAARQVRDGAVDCCISTRGVARAMSLDFIPLAEKPYHLLVRRAHLELEPVKVLLAAMERASFRREVEAATGYDMRCAGERLL